LARGPLRQAKSWPIYFVNGFKFHTTSWGEGKTTYNSGVCVSGIGHDGTPNDYYGVVREILEFEWPCQETRKLVLFYCDWFDPSNRGMRIHNQYKIEKCEKGENIINMILSFSQRLQLKFILHLILAAKGIRLIGW
jgi:hypothetical protein